MRLLDLFSGIGGFHKGFEQAGFEFEWVGFSDIDKYASAVYKHRFPNAKELGDVAAIRPERDLPNHIDILCGGFPCQAFSMAGKRKGFDDTRGTLFFEIARILRYYIDIGKPIDHFVLENVKGLLSHDGGRTFAVIYGVLTDLGYTVESQLLNTKWLLPQNRERIYIVGHIGRGSRAKVFPITKNDKRNYEEQLSRAQAKGQGQGVQHTQDWRRRTLLGDGQVMVKEATSKGYAVAQEGDSINFCNPNSKTRRGRVGKGIAQTLDTGMEQATIQRTNIRRLTPIECERLQGFPDQWTSQGNLDGKVVDISDTQRYKQCGNAVSVPIVQLVAERIKHGQI